MSQTLIINRPSLIPPHKRIIFHASTLVIWSVWIYLWLPLTTLLGWWVAGLLGYEHMVVRGGYVDLLHLLGWYALVILCMGGALLIWATYNLLRFRGKERRNPLPEVTIKNFGQYFGVAAADLAVWRKSKVLDVHHTIEGVLQQIDVHHTPAHS